MRLTMLFALTASSLLAADNSFLLKNVTVHAVSGPNLANASLLVLDGRIAEVGVKLISKAKVKIIDAKGLHVYPGMIDAGTMVGISEVSSVRETSDYGDVGDFNPQLRAAVAVNPESEHIPVTRANGITSVLVLPGTPSDGGRGAAGGYIQGQASLMHLDGWTWEQMRIQSGGALLVRLPSMTGGGTFDPATFSRRPAAFAESKRNYEDQMRSIRAFFDDARRYSAAKLAKDPGLKPDVKFEAMLPVLEGKVPVIIPVTRQRDVRLAIEFAEKQKLKLILAGLRDPGDQLKAIADKKIPVILGSPFETPLGDDDDYDQPYTLAGRLNQAGVKFAFASFGEQFARNLPYQAGQSSNFGLPKDVALKSVTLNAAEILGVASMVGSIETGKVADLIVTDGDPLEIRTQVKMMFIEGRAVNLESKHTRLYQKYLNRP
ncbi:MAG TPA: amidohydrolase family protein [Bryobacteraceae bacterium]|nr:amidohydrolase family protein [Bryobacteraceae bacterium]